MLVSDNGTPFTSVEFRTFCDINGIRHLRIPPYHPASNGLAERAVATVKSGISKQQRGDLAQKLARFLLEYRRTPQATTGVSPAELGSKLRTRLDLLRPSLSSNVEAKAEKWPRVRERRAPDDGTPVMVRNYGQGTPWIPGTVVKTRSPHSIMVQTQNGLAHRHPDQLRKATSQSVTPDHDDDDWQITPLQPNNDQIIQPPEQPIRRSQRERHVPDRLNL